VSVAVATWVRVLLDPVLGDLVPIPTLFFAVLLTAWYEGVGPAVVAVILGGFSAQYFLIPPRGGFAVASANQYVELAFYIAVNAGIVTHAGFMQAAFLRTIRKLRNARETLTQT
jgi:K+-sensing histidine kinase KdpD